MKQETSNAEKLLLLYFLFFLLLLIGGWFILGWDGLWQHPERLVIGTIGYGTLVWLFRYRL